MSSKIRRSERKLCEVFSISHTATRLVVKQTSVSDLTSPLGINSFYLGSVRPALCLLSDSFL